MNESVRLLENIEENAKKRSVESERTTERAASEMGKSVENGQGKSAGRDGQKLRAPVRNDLKTVSERCF